GAVPGSALELAPSWYEATSTSYSTPSAAISSTTSLTASTGSPKVRPSIAVGLTLPTVLVVTAPITATSTPSCSSTVYASWIRSPVAASYTFAARSGKSVRGSMRSSRSSTPWSYSWLPIAVASTPIALSTSRVGSSFCTADSKEEPPTLSPAESRN